MWFAFSIHFYLWLMRLVRGRPTLSAALRTLAVTLLAVLSLAYLAFLAITETIHAYREAMGWVQSGGLKRLLVLVAGLLLIGHISQELLGRFVLALAYGDLQGSLLEGGKTISSADRA